MGNEKFKELLSIIFGLEIDKFDFEAIVAIAEERTKKCKNKRKNERKKELKLARKTETKRIEAIPKELRSEEDGVFLQSLLPWMEDES